MSGLKPEIIALLDSLTSKCDEANRAGWISEKDIDQIHLDISDIREIIDSS